MLIKIEILNDRDELAGRVETASQEVAEQKMDQIIRLMKETEEATEQAISHEEEEKGGDNDE